MTRRVAGNETHLLRTGTVCGLPGGTASAAQVPRCRGSQREGGHEHPDSFPLLAPTPAGPQEAAGGPGTALHPSPRHRDQLASTGLSGTGCRTQPMPPPSPPPQPP